MFELPNIPIMGWAAVYGVTGGGSGELHEYSDFGAMFENIASVGNTAKNYIYTGPNVYLPDFHDSNARLLIPTNNKTILSDGTQELLDGNMRVNGRTNIIWANWRHRRTNNDAFAVNDGSVGIVIDHCWFDLEDFNGPSDAVIDIRGESNFCQVSNSFMRNGSRCMAFGASAGGPSTNIKITMALNNIADFTSRNPRVNQGQVHIYANHFSMSVPFGGLTIKQVEVSSNSQIYSQNNYYENGSRLFDDADGTGALKSVGDFIGDYASRTTEVRPENVLWSPDDVSGYTVPLFTAEQALAYTAESAGNVGATLFLNPEPPEPSAGSFRLRIRFT
jgi:pectate lyase